MMVCFLTTPGSAQGLCLALGLGFAPGRAQGLWDVGDQTWIATCEVSTLPTYAITPALGPWFLISVLVWLISGSTHMKLSGKAMSYISQDI